MRPRTARCASLVALVAVLTACRATTPATTTSPADPERPSAEVVEQAEPDEPTPAQEPAEEDCAVDGLPAQDLILLDGADVADLAATVAATTHRCAPLAVVAGAGEWDAALAAPLALARRAPLLVAGDGGTVPGLADLDIERTVVVATEGAPSPGVVATDTLVGDDALATALAVVDHLDADRALAVPEGDRVGRAEALVHDGGGLPLLPLPTDAEDLAALSASLPPDLRLDVVASDPDVARALADELVAVGVDAQPAEAGSDPTPGGTLWLADPAQTSATAVAARAATARGEPLLPVHARDPRQGRERTQRIADAAPARSVLVGEVTEHADWKLATVLEGPRLPGGGLTLFEDERIVALYGTPTSTRLGALGEQDLDATVDRARQVAEPYGADGRRVVPAFELIVTIASAEAGERGDHSRRLDPGSFRPWVDRAAEEGFHVVLDLQPGRTDFLSQAKEYEELLLEPHVGLALDPEWRLEDDQVHLRQIGSVDAAEVQQVVDWLAGLVREHRLPQKLLVLHQFRSSMLPDRDAIVAPPELAVVIHMDGQGPIGDKYATYAAITAGAEDRWWWGWKNFYDEDDPTPTPAQVLALDPVPVFVSYQ